jgi:aarF domain-containing kinase
LTDQASAEPWSCVYAAILDRELPGWEHTFLIREDAELLGSGSVAQVFKGSVRVNQAPVAIKVLRPGVKRQIAADLAVLERVAVIAEWLFPAWGPRDAVAQFRESLESQLDLLNEAIHLNRFRDNFAGNPYVKFPRPMSPWVSESVLIESFEDGIPLLSIEGPEKRKKMARVGLISLLQMVFEDNLVHGDLHSGNLRYIPREDALLFLDAGIVCELVPQDRLNFLDLFEAIALNEGYRVGELMVERTRPSSLDVLSEEAKHQFCKEMEELVDQVTSTHLKPQDIGAGNVLQQVMALCSRHGVRIEPRFVNVAVAMGILEGLGNSLDPEIDIMTAAIPVILSAKFAAF